MRQARPIVVAATALACCCIGGLDGRALAQPGAQADAPVLERFEYTQVHMGLPVRVVLYERTEAAARDAAAAAFARIAALDAIMSDYRADSELRRLGASPTRVSAELFDVVARAIDIARLTDGAFDPTVGPVVVLWRDARRLRRLPDPPRLAEARSLVGWQHVDLDRRRRTIRLGRPGMRLDLGGIAKGWILQDTAARLAGRGVTRVLLEGGGDVVVGDPPPGKAGWSIDTPGADAALAERAARLTNAALATSGPAMQFVEIDGIRYSHVVDPRTGIGLTASTTANVIARDGATADALATALTVAGPDRAADLLRRFPSVVASVHGDR